MIITKKAVSTVGIGAAVVVGSLMATSLVGAHPFSDESREERVAELAERFNLNEDEVRTYFEEKREEHRAEMEEKHAQRLAELVEDGTLTQEQADALSAKHEEMRQGMEELRESDASREEIHEEMESLREELEAWAEEQGIDLDSIRAEGKHGHRGGHHRGGSDE